MEAAQWGDFCQSAAARFPCSPDHRSLQLMRPLMAGSIQNLRWFPCAYSSYRKVIVIFPVAFISLLLSCTTQESSDSTGAGGAGDPDSLLSPSNPQSQGHESSKNSGRGNTHTPFHATTPQTAQNRRMSSNFNDRSIDDIINSVNAMEDDQNLKADASLSKVLESGRIPLEMNAAVQKWIGYFTGRDRDRFQRFLNRGETYRPMIMAVLRDQQIPPELYFQAMIESGFQVHAKSHAQAVGIWQFIKPTGKRYGLRVNQSIDERRDPVRATIAASLYLRDLYNVFQSWYLAMAAYNAGEGRILNAIMKAKTRDFWEIARRRQLPSETMDYVPKFLAAAIIGHNPEKFGFAIPPPPESFKLASIQAPGGRSLPVLAKALEVPLESLKELNPHLLRQVTPYDAGSYRLWLPAAHTENITSEQLAAIPPSSPLQQDREELRRSINSQGSQNFQDEDKIVHRVRRGETLAKIALLYQVPIGEIRELNKIKSHKIMVGQKILIASPEKDGPKSGGDRLADAKNQLIRYTVRPGDNLAILAQKFGITVTELKRLNRLRHHKIYAGQVLKVASKG